MLTSVQIFEHLGAYAHLNHIPHSVLSHRKREFISSLDSFGCVCFISAFTARVPVFYSDDKPSRGQTERNANRYVHLQHENYL